MTLLETLVAQGVRAFKEPRQAAADILALGVPREALIPGLVLVTAITVLLNYLSEQIAPTPLSVLAPFQVAGFVLILFASLAVGVCKIGQAMDGLGKCEDALLVIVMLQAIFLPVQVLQLALLAISPALAGLLQLVILIFWIWININFVAALHSYTSLGKAAAVLVLSFFLSFIVLMFVGPMLGISLAEVAPNV